MMEVLPLKSEETHDWCLNVHYAKRIPNIQFAFGLFDKSSLEGVVTYGMPPSPSLCIGVAGKKNAPLVIELNRLVFRKPIKNAASILVGKSLAMLPKPKIVVSYADCEQNHVGYIYQATNFIYTGLSAKYTGWKIKGLEHLHSKAVSNMARGQENPAEYLRQKYGRDFYRAEQTRKHRYVFICADKKTKKRLLSELMYPIEAYPKGDSQRYAINYSPSTQNQLFACFQEEP